jgi:hypothetical protein
MHAYRSLEESEEAREEGTPNTLSIPWVVLAAVLIGVGLFALFVWVVNFSQWVWFGGIAPVVIGALMLFSKRAGSDQAGDSR